MWRYATVGACAFFLATSVGAQDAIEIKISKPKVGDRTKQIRDESSDSQFAITAGGNEQAKNEKATKSLVYVEEVLAVVGDSDRPSKVKRTYEKARVTRDGNGSTLDIEGKTVFVEKKGEKFEFTVDGKEVDAESQKLLAGEFNKPDQDDPRDLMLPKKPVKPGESWKIDTDAFTKSLAKSFTFEKQKVDATGKLVKAYKVGDRQFGVIELKVNAPITGLGEKAAITVKDGALSFTITGDGCVDGSAAEGKSSMAMKLTVSGMGKGFEIKGEVNTKESRTTVTLPKK